MLVCICTHGYTRIGERVCVYVYLHACIKDTYVCVTVSHAYVFACARERERESERAREICVCMHCV